MDHDFIAIGVWLFYLGLWTGDYLADSKRRVSDFLRALLRFVCALPLVFLLVVFFQ